MRIHIGDYLAIRYVILNLPWPPSTNNKDILAVVMFIPTPYLAHSKYLIFMTAICRYPPALHLAMHAG